MIPDVKRMSDVAAINTQLNICNDGRDDDSFDLSKAMRKTMKKTEIENRRKIRNLISKFRTDFAIFYRK